MRMNTMTKKILMRLKSVLLSGLFILIVNAPSLSVTVLNGRGLIGVYGQPNVTLSGSTLSYSGYSPSSYVQLYNFYNGIIYECRNDPRVLKVIDGVAGVPIAQGEMIIVPEIVFVDERRNARTKSYIDTIVGHFNGWGSGTNEQLGVDSDCLWAPRQSSPATGQGTESEINHLVVATGRFLIYGTGNQRSGTYYLRDGIGISIRNPRGREISRALSSDRVYIEVSGLTCTLNAPNYVNFGPHSASSQSNELLATVKNSMSVNCDQVYNKIAATISLSGNVKPQYYSGNSLEINLLDTQQKPGAYVKMYVMVNGNKTPITVDQSPIDLAKITAQQTNVSVNNELVYELYSRGNNVAGKVSGSAELSIIMR